LSNSQDASVENALEADPDADPPNLTYSAAEAGRMRAPSLMNISHRTNHTHKRHRLSGRWVRHQGKIIVLGVDDLEQTHIGSSWNSFEAHRPLSETALSEEVQPKLTTNPMELESEEEFEHFATEIPSYNAEAAAAYARKFWNGSH
jgi:hypothetical protein